MITKTREHRLMEQREEERIEKKKNHNRETQGREVRRDWARGGERGRQGR